MSAWLVSPEELTLEQRRAVRLGTEKHRVILGSPGSGKTQVLLHRARHLMAELSLRDKDVRIFTYTRALSRYLAAAMGKLGLPVAMAMTLDRWAMMYLKRTMKSQVPMNGKEADFAAIRLQVTAYLRQLPKKPFRVALVDETQDLDADGVQLLLALADHVTFCMDDKQQLYNDRITIDQLSSIVGSNQSTMNLLPTFRCCPYLVRLAAQFICQDKERQEYLHQPRTEQKSRETPLLYFAKDYEDERRQLHSMVQQRLSRRERVAVLFPTSKQAYGYATGFRQSGIGVEDPDQIDFSTSAPKFLPYHSVKGLTFDSVFLPCLGHSHLKEMVLTRRMKLLFTGLTRATSWAYMSTLDGEADFPISLLAPVIHEKKLSLRINHDVGYTKILENYIAYIIKHILGHMVNLEFVFDNDVEKPKIFIYFDVVNHVADRAREISIAEAAACGIETSTGEELGFQLFWHPDDQGYAVEQDKDYRSILGFQQTDSLLGKEIAQAIELFRSASGRVITKNVSSNVAISSDVQVVDELDDLLLAASAVRSIR